MVTIITGTTQKPTSSDLLKSFFQRHNELDGYLYIGYPIIGTVDGAYPIDSLWVSPDKGLVIFNLIEGKNIDGYEEAQDDLRANKNLGIYKGALYENFVAEAFLKQGLGLYYYKKENATLEEDFFVRTKDALIPVEVKANKNSSKSLNQLISNKNYSDIHYGIKLGDSNIGFENNIYTFPYFCAFLLKRYLKKQN